MKTYSIFAFLLTFIFGIDCDNDYPNPLAPHLPRRYPNPPSSGPYSSSGGQRFIPKWGYYYDGIGVLRWGAVNNPVTLKRIAEGRPVHNDRKVNSNDPNARYVETIKHVPQAPVRNYYRRN